MDKIVFLESEITNPGDISWQGLEKLGKFITHKSTNRAETLEHAKEADILVVNKVLIDKEFFKACPNVKYICESATGYDNIDIKAAKMNGVPVSNVRGYSTESVGQHVFSLLLHHIQKVARYDKQVKNQKWSKLGVFSYYDYPIKALADMTIGIWGYGNIGSSVAKIADSFGMKVISTHRHPERDKNKYVKFVSKEELFTQSDVISLHIPLTSENYKIVDNKLLSLMKKDAVLINTARGGVINEEDLYEALFDRRIGGALLDVMTTEPIRPDHPFLKLDNCIITPHIAWASQYARKQLLKGVKSNIKSFQKGKEIKNRIV